MGGPEAEGSAASRAGRSRVVSAVGRLPIALDPCSNGALDPAGRAEQGPGQYTTMSNEPTRAVANKITEHEEAAHEKRNWVRLTFDCNNRCVFCLDSDTHDGEIRDREDIKHEILDGRRKGASRLILSGGEPTIHPNFVDFVRLGKRAGYPWIQTVTNGRLFAYPEFLAKCLDAGLNEITFSIHGPNAKVHDALVGVKGAYEQEIAGLRAALADGRPVVNVDVVINRGNVRHLPEMLRMYIEMGVREFDLLQVVPFGRAFTEGRDTLFYDIEEMRPYLLAALEFSKRPDVHIWFNRFPPQHLEGYEHLIQDPYKLNDEVRGRKEEFARLLDEGVQLDCRDPARCRYCYLERLCDTLDRVRAMVASRCFDTVRVDTEWEAQQGPVYGGDPASARRARARALARRDGRRGLPVFEGPMRAPLRTPSLEELVREAAPRVLWVRAPDLGRALAVVTRFPDVPEIELELDDYAGLESALGADDVLAGRRLVRARARGSVQAEGLLALGSRFEVRVMLTRETASWLLALDEVPSRLSLAQPAYERLSEAAEHDVDLRDFFTRFSHPVPVEGVPACVTGRAEPPRPRVLDTAMFDPEGRLEVFRYTRRYILEHYKTRSLRCSACMHADGCEGMHINHVRAHGYAVMRPVTPHGE